MMLYIVLILLIFTVLVFLIDSLIDKFKLLRRNNTLRIQLNAIQRTKECDDDMHQHHVAEVARLRLKIKELKAQLEEALAHESKRH